MEKNSIYKGGIAAEASSSDQSLMVIEFFLI